MNETFFPVHIAGQIILYNVITAGVFWLMVATGIDHTVRDTAKARGLKLGLGVFLAAWYALLLPLVFNGWISVFPGDFFGIPTLPLAIVIPLILALFVFNRPGARLVLDAIPMQWFTGFHFLRAAFGSVFLALYELGAIPALFAFRGGYGDITAGVLGALAGFLYLQKARPAFARTALVIFSVLGLADFALVLYTGLTILQPQAPFAEFYPFQLIPSYVVPLFILTHLFALRALWREVRVPAGIVEEDRLAGGGENRTRRLGRAV